MIDRRLIKVAADLDEIDAGLKQLSADIDKMQQAHREELDRLRAENAALRKNFVPPKRLQRLLDMEQIALKHMKGEPSP